MYRKLIVLFSALAVAFSISACGNSSSSQPTTTPVQPTTVPTETTEAVNVETETTAPGFTPVTLVDDENCTVTVTGIDPDNIFGYTLNVFLENKTDLELMYTLDSVSVNGYMCDPFWASTIASGKKSNEKITFMESDFEDNGITEVTDITFTLRIYDNNDWAAENLIEQTFTLNP